MNEEIETKRSFVDVMKEQQEKGEANELLVLYYVARFYFLSSHQLSKIIEIEHGVLRHILRRLVKSNQLQVDNFESSRTKAYALTRSGVNRIQEDLAEKITCRYGRFLFEDGFNYHRHVANDFVINFCSGHLNFHNLECEEFISENEIIKKNSMYLSYFGSVPDCLAVTTDKRLVVIEVENTYRSTQWHGPKLRDWLNTCADRYERDGFVADEYPKPIGRFEDVEQVFVCTSELNFRSMYRMVERALGELSYFKDNISYWVIPNVIWVNPALSGELLVHGEPETAERVKKGERLYKRSDEFMMMVLNEIKDNPKVTLLDIAKKHCVSRSTISRWNIKFGYIYKR